jgi:hypothetical protein
MRVQSICVETEAACPRTPWRIFGVCPLVRDLLSTAPFTPRYSPAPHGRKEKMNYASDPVRYASKRDDTVAASG